jgi:hypothetical protein
MQKVYLLLFMTVFIGLIILAAYFCHSCLSQAECNCSLIKVDWLTACIALEYSYLALYLLVSSGVGVKFAQSASQWEAKADT